MAYFEPSYALASGGMLRRLAALFETPFDSRAKRLAAQVSDLRSRSDAELASIGITRDQILPYVFAGRSTKG